MSSWQAAREVRPIPTELKKLPRCAAATDRRYGAHRGVRADAADVAVEQQLLHRGRDGDLSRSSPSRSSCSPVGPATSASGRWRSRRSAARSAAWVTQNTALGSRRSRSSRRGVAGALVAVVIGIPAARAAASRSRSRRSRSRPRSCIGSSIPSSSTGSRAGAFDSDPTLFGTHRDQVADELLLLTLSLLALRDRGRVRHPAQPHRPRAHRDAREPARRGGVRHQRDCARCSSGFAISGFLAAIAGVLFVHHQHMISQDIAEQPVLAPSRACASSRSSSSAAWRRYRARSSARSTCSAMQYYMLPEWRFLATGVGLLAILLILPGGLGAGLAEARDGGLRWIARRRNIIVPSLLADRRVDDARDDAVDGRRRGRRGRGGPRSKRSWRCAMSDNAPRPRTPTAPSDAVMFQLAGHRRAPATRRRRYFTDADGRLRDLSARRAVRAQRGRRARPHRRSASSARRSATLRAQQPGVT